VPHSFKHSREILNRLNKNIDITSLELLASQFSATSKFNEQRMEALFRKEKSKKYKVLSNISHVESYAASALVNTIRCIKNNDYNFVDTQQIIKQLTGALEAHSFVYSKTQETDHVAYAKQILTSAIGHV
jgi:hypothetical protein